MLSTVHILPLPRQSIVQRFPATHSFPRLSMHRLLRAPALAALFLMAASSGGAQAQLPDGLADLEEARTRQCVLGAVEPPSAQNTQLLAERGAGLRTILDTSQFQGVMRGGEALPPQMVALQQKIERYNREYSDLMTECREADRAGTDCNETRDMESLRSEIRAEAEELLREMSQNETGGGAGAWNTWAMECADRLLLRAVVAEVCPEGSAAICTAQGDQFQAHGVTLRMVDDLEALWDFGVDEPWSAFEPLTVAETDAANGAAPGAVTGAVTGAVSGGATRTRVQIGNIIAEVRLGLDLVNTSEDPGRAAAARAFAAAFDMEFEVAGWTVLPVIEFSLKQAAPLLRETVYAFFVETESGPATVLNAEADADQPFAWSTPLRPEVAEWLQSGRTLWFTAGGPLPGGGMGPRFTFSFPTEGLQDSILDMAIYLTGDVMPDLARIAADRRSNGRDTFDTPH